ncbi:MAG TPA: hypothetical protein VES62_17640, partial [Thermoleophilaceae bacterium]|nr:hypothetical protein [Thermoleophilaceae bacterium]
MQGRLRPVESGERRGGSDSTVVVIGDGDLSKETASALEALGAEVTHLGEPEQDEVREALEGEDIDTVAVVGRTDAVVLRRALMVRDVSGDVPLLLTIFDPTMARTMERELGHTQVTSLADIVAPSLAGPCIDERFTAIGDDDDQPVGLVEDGEDVREEPIP